MTDILKKIFHNPSIPSTNLKTIPSVTASTVFIGPWMGEVGPELLYWIPYIRYLKNKQFFFNKRLIVVSRGGVNNWYRDISDEYIEIFQYITSKQFLNIRDDSIQKGKKKKQITYTDKEKYLIEQIGKKNNIKEYEIVHPSDMWKNMLPWVREQVTLNQATEKLSFKLIQKPDPKYQKIVDSIRLPKQYISSKFYSNPLLPKTQQNLNCIKSVVKLLSKEVPIIDLAMKDKVDDHKDFGAIKTKHLIKLGKKLTVTENLGIQTEIIRRSRFFIGTNGGFSILPMMLNIPVLCFYSEPLQERMQNYCQHETMRMKCHESIGKASYTVLHCNTWEILKDFIKF